MTSDQTSSYISDQPPELHTRRSRWLFWWLRPRVAIPLLLLLLTLASPLVIRGYKLSQVPVAAEPFDIQAVLDHVVPNEKNAFVEYRQAAEKYVELPPTEDESLAVAMQGEWQRAPDSIRNWLSDNRLAIELWKQGTAKADSQYFRAGDIDMATLQPVLNSLRPLSRLVVIEASRLRAAGHPEEAWELLRTGLRASHHIGRRGAFIERLIGIACGAIISEGIRQWAQDPLVTKEMLLRVQDALDVEHRENPPCSWALQAEYLLLRKTLQSPVQLQLLIDDEIRSPTLSRLGRVGIFAVGEPELCDRCIRHVIGNYLREMDKPRRKRPLQCGRLGLFELGPTPGADTPTPVQLDEWVSHSVVSEVLMSVIPNFLGACDRVELRHSMLKTIFALELYRREHGRYPDTLAALVPDFMVEIPDDIFEPSPVPVKYRHQNGRVTLWSVGQNGIDEGGSIDDSRDYGHRLGPQDPMSQIEPGDAAIKMPD